MNTLTISKIGIENKAGGTPNPPVERFHSLDALRAFALLLGVFFHSLMAYILPPGIWAVGTTSPSTALFWFVYYSHCFRMEVFFLLAGFFARLVIEKRGVSAFLRDRARRILLVFVVALYPMKLLLSSAWITGGLKTGWLKLPPQVAQLPLWQLSVGGLRMESWPNINLTHLWFLYYLASISGLFVAARWLILRTGRSASLSKTIDPGFRRVVASWFAPLCLTLCVTPVLTMMSGPDVDTPDKSLAWNYPVLLLYGLFFGVGWCLHRQTHLLGILARRWQVFLPLSLVIGVIASLGVGLRISGGAWAAEHAAALRWTGSLGTSLTMSLAVLGWLGLFVRFFDRSSHSIRYLADSSYWVYLAHLPLIVGFQVWFSAWPIAWPVKVLAINACAFAILLSSYHLLIRFTWIGAWLNGRRAQRVKHTIREGVKLDYVQPGTSR